MRVICSWCENEGRPALVREKAPLSDDRETHGICSNHLQQLGMGRDPLVPCYEEGLVPRCEPVLTRRRYDSSTALL